MEAGRLTELLRIATGISQLHAYDMPASALPADANAKHFVMINVGPMPFDENNPGETLNNCHKIINKIVSLAMAEGGLAHYRLGFSIFINPGGQSGRALSGWIDMNRAINNSPGMPLLNDMYSNIRSISNIIKR